MNSLKEEYVHPRENDAKRATCPWGKFIYQRKNDVGRFRECSLIKRACSPRGTFTPVNDKIVGNVNSPRNKARERHVSPAKLVFPGGRHSSPREEVVEKKKPMRCIIPLIGGMWYNTKKFP